MSKMHPHIHTAPFSLTMFRLCLRTLIYTQVTSFCPLVLTLRSLQSLIGINGWYPDYWEYCKARWTSRIGQEWELKYLPLVLDRREFYDYWDYFVLARGV
jgi:hypothetical protein